MIDQIKLTENEITLLTNAYVNKEEIMKGFLQDYQLEILEQIRQAKDYLFQKYTLTHFLFLQVTPYGKGNEWTEILFTDDDTLENPVLYTLRAAKCKEGNRFVDNYYGKILKPRYEKWIQETLRESGYEVICDVEFPYPKGMEVSGKEDQEFIISQGEKIGKRVVLYTRIPEEDGEELLEQLLNDQLFAYYQLFFLQMEDGIPFNKITCEAFIKEQNNQNRWSRKYYHSILPIDQLLLLEHLTYARDHQPFQTIVHGEGKTVKEIIDAIDQSQIIDDLNYGSFLTGADWKNVIMAIRKHEDLLDIKAETVHVDYAQGGGGGVSVLFFNEKTREAIVTFRGTGSYEWADDFIAGNVVATPQQINGLEWYRKVYEEYHLEQYYVTLLGHSKGANKIKYITIVDGRVDRCVSFDGQGFSDVFFETYHDEILENQYKIENHNVDYDYVSILLNDVGKTIYYHGYDYGKGGFLESHAPNTYFDFGENGDYVMRVNPEGQSKELKMVDMYFNAFLRSMDKEHQNDTLLIIGMLMERGFSGGSKNTPKEEQDSFFDFFTDLILNEKYKDDVAYLLAFTIKYGQEYPNFLKSMYKIMSNFGMVAVAQYIDLVMKIINYEHFDMVFGVVNYASNNIPAFALQRILSFLEGKYKIKLSEQQARGFLTILPEAKKCLKTVKVNYDGHDIVLE